MREQFSLAIKYLSISMKRILTKEEGEAMSKPRNTLSTIIILSTLIILSCALFVTIAAVANRVAGYQ